MNRGSFLKKLFQGAAVVAVSPSVLSKVGASANVKSKYIEGYVTLTKEMMKDLPFLQSQLPKMLIRDYMNKENKMWQDGL